MKGYVFMAWDLLKHRETLPLLKMLYHIDWETLSSNIWHPDSLFF